MHIFFESFLNQAKLSKKQSLWLFGGIFFVLAWGIFLRLYGLGASSYWIDEGFTYAQAKAIATHGYPLLASGIVEWKDPLVPYLNAPFALLGLEHNAAIMRLWNALFGIGSIIVGCMLARNLFSLRVALMYTIALSMGYWFVAWSQQLRGYSGLLFFLLLVFYFLERAVADRSDRRYLWWACGGVMFAIASNKLGVVLFVPLVSVALALGAYGFLSAITLLIILLGGYFSSFVVHFFSESLHNYNSFYFGHLFGDSIVLIVLMICGFVFSLWKSPKQAFHLGVLYWALMVFIVLSTFVKTGEKRYIFMLFPLLFLYACYGISVTSGIIAGIVERVLSLTRESLARLEICVLVAVFGTFLFVERAYFVFWPQEEYLLEVYTPQPDFFGVYEAITARGFDKGDTIISPFPWMDELYLGRSGYSIPWSLTGKNGDTALVDEYDYYTQAPAIIPEIATDVDLTKARLAIVALRTQGEVYVVLDLLSRRRMSQDLRHFIESDKDAEMLFQSKTGLDEVAVYVFSQIRGEFIRQ